MARRECSANTPISVTFNRAANISSITVNTANTVCKGTLQVSSNNFAKCVKMAGAPTPGAGNTTFTVNPAANLNSGTTYKIRVTTGAQAADGVPLAATYTQPVGFTSAVRNTATNTANGFQRYRY